MSVQPPGGLGSGGYVPEQPRGPEGAPAPGFKTATSPSDFEQVRDALQKWLDAHPNVSPEARATMEQGIDAAKKLASDPHPNPYTMPAEFEKVSKAMQQLNEIDMEAHRVDKGL